MTKQLLNIRGQLKLNVFIQYKNVYGEVNGFDSSENVKRDFKILLKNAVINAKYRFIKGRGIPFKTNMLINFKIIDYDINYNNEFVVTRKRYKTKGKYNYYNVVKNKNGKVIHKYKFKYKEEFEEPDIYVKGRED